MDTIRLKSTLKLQEAISFPLSSIMSQNFAQVGVVALTSNPILKEHFQFETVSKSKQRNKTANKFHYSFLFKNFFSIKAISF